LSRIYKTPSNFKVTIEFSPPHGGEQPLAGHSSTSSFVSPKGFFIDARLDLQRPDKERIGSYH
jgi:hypothetical protein